MAAAPKAVLANFGTPQVLIYSYTCAASLPLSKGTLVELVDPFTVSMANAWTASTLATSGAFVGIVFRDKAAGDTEVQVSVLKEGRADIRASGAITKGFPVYCAGNDEVMALSATMNAGVSNAVSIGLFNSMMVGIAEETATDQEVILVRFNK